MAKQLRWLAIISILLIFTSCAGSGTKEYAVSGRVIDRDGNGLAGVTIAPIEQLQGAGVATTNAEGLFTLRGLSGSVVLKPLKDGYIFFPTQRSVTGPTTNVNFAGSVLTTKNVGPTGQSLISSDNLVQITIPPNALSEEVLISICEALIDDMGTVGSVYQLEPVGITFKLPVSIKFSFLTESIPHGFSGQDLALARRIDPNWNILESTVDQDAKTVSATVNQFSMFAIVPTHSLGVGLEGGGTTFPQAGLHVYAHEDEVTLYAEAAQGYTFEYWLVIMGSGQTFYKTPNVTFVITSDTDAIAVFSELDPAPDHSYLTMITVGSGETLPPMGRHEYPNGTRIDLTAKPSIDWHFDIWSVQNDPFESPKSSSTSPQWELTIVENLWVTAYFSCEPIYSVSGYTLLDDGTPVKNANISFSGGFPDTQTDAEGFWQSDLKGLVTISAAASNVSFTPVSIVVHGPATDVNFTGLADYELVFYDSVKIIGRAEQTNIQGINDEQTRLTFGKKTTFVESLRVDDILIANSYDLLTPLRAQSTIPKEGLLTRVISISKDGLELTLAKANLDEAIRKGTIVFTDTIPFEQVAASAVFDSRVDLLSFSQIDRRLTIQWQVTQGVYVNGYLRFLLDLDLDGSFSFDEGLEDFRFVIGPGMEADLSLLIGAQMNLEMEQILASWSGFPTHPIFVFPGVVIYPGIDFVVGVRGLTQAGAELGVKYSRYLQAGIEYERTKGWAGVWNMTGDGWDVAEPTFVGSATAKAYAGIKFSGLVYDAIGLYAGPFLYADAMAKVRTAPWEWEYRLGIGLDLLVGAELEILRIAKISIDLARMNPWHMNLAYGVSGRVIDYLPMGIPNAKVRFSDGSKSVFPVGELGFWQKHLLSGDVVVGPELKGYTFEPKSQNVSGPRSDLVFFGTYQVTGAIRDLDEQGIPGVMLKFNSLVDTNFSVKPVQSNGAGIWERNKLYGPIRVTPELEGYSFKPSHQVVEQPNQQVDFSATYQVSGLVSNAAGDGMGGVEIRFNAPVDPVYTTSNGTWQRDGLSGTVTVTAFKDGFEFTPTSKVVFKPATDVNFTEAYSVSGLVRDSHFNGIQGVTITFSDDIPSVKTDHTGFWEKSGLFGTVTVKPNKQNYTFEPATRTISGPSAIVNFIGFETIEYLLGETSFSMVFAPSGTYPKDRWNTDPNNPPMVTIDNPYFIAQTEVTYALWYPVRIWAEEHGYIFFDKGREGSSGWTGKAPSLDRYEPVTEVTWVDCIVWSNALSEYLGYLPVYTLNGITVKDALTFFGNNKEDTRNIIAENNNGFRLPTDDEWELAARYRSDGTWTPWDYASGANGPTISTPFNNSYTQEVAWVYQNSGGKTKEVAQKPSNGLGVHDMSGNVFEWVWDSMVLNMSWTDQRLLRGGSFQDQGCVVGGWPEEEPRMNDATNALESWGFRLVRSP